MGVFDPAARYNFETTYRKKTIIVHFGDSVARKSFPNKSDLEDEHETVF